MKITVMNNVFVYILFSILLLLQNFQHFITKTKIVYACFIIIVITNCLYCVLEIVQHYIGTYELLYFKFCCKTFNISYLNLFYIIY